ncbi:MAG: hypothetical protein Kow00127_15680 [Bacteroidales bacterium]
MKEKVLKYVIAVGGVIALYAFLAVRILPLFNLAMVEPRHPEYFEFTRYGEQYYVSYVSHFREILPTPVDKYRLSDRNPDLEDADIIAFGDSFFDFSRQKTVAERLHDSLDVPVHAVRGWYPLDYLNSHDFHPGKPRLIIYEVVERNLHQRFIEKHDLNWEGNDYMDISSLSLPRRIKHWIFDIKSEELYSLLLQGSWLTTGFYSLFATWKFDLFGFIASRTPVYSLHNKYDTPFLFYDITVNDEPTGFYHPHPDSLIDVYCQTLSDLAQQLEERYNLKMIFVPVPNKYTMYYDVVEPDDRYNQFLPRFYRKMDQYGINYVNLYKPFSNSGKLLYYGTDSHWNKNGVDIAVEKILEKVKQEPEYQVLINGKTNR